MNEAAQKISEALTCTGFKNIQIGDRYFPVYPVKVRVLAELLSPLSKIVAEKGSTMIEAIAVSPQNSSLINQVIALAVAGKYKSRFKRWRIKKQVLHEAKEFNGKQQYDAYIAVLSQIDGSSFFNSAILGKNLALQMAKPAPLETTL